MSQIGEQIQNLRTLQQSYDVLADKLASTDGYPIYSISNDVSSVALEPNSLYIFTSRTNDLTITFATPTNPNIANEYHFILFIGSILPTISLPSSVQFSSYDLADILDVNHTYEVSVLNNLGIVVQW